jgi:hypothetical protein
MIDSFDSLQPWLHMKGGFFQKKFRASGMGFFRTHLLIFGEPAVKCSHIPEPYPQSLSLKF